MESDSKLALRHVLGPKGPDSWLFSAPKAQQALPFSSVLRDSRLGSPVRGQLDHEKNLLAPWKGPSPSPMGARAAFTGEIIRNLILISPTLLIVCGQFDCNSRH